MKFAVSYQQTVSDSFSDLTEKKTLRHQCTLCHRRFHHQPLNRCLYCGGAIDIFYDLKKVVINDTLNPLEKYCDLLPVKNRDNLFWLGEGNTPCIHSSYLGKKLGLPNLYFKDETANPTRTTKDRIASVGLSYLADLGIHEFAIASTGNSSTAYARGVQLTNRFHVHIFSGRNFLNRLNYSDHPGIKTYVVESDFVSAGKAAKEFAQQKNIFFEGGFFNPARREGLKLAYLEAFDQMPVTPKYVFQAVSSGMGLLGAYKGALEYNMLGRLSFMPTFIAVQQQSCAPMANAFQEGSSIIKDHHIIHNPSGLAAAILRGDPSQSYPYIHSLVQTTGGQILQANAREIAWARQMLWEFEGIHVCYASATALAGMIKLVKEKQISEREPILINLTGADRPRNPVAQNLISYAFETTVTTEQQVALGAA